MAIKINTAYGEILTSNMLNEKVSGVVGGNEKVSGFDVAIKTSTSVTIQPGRAYINGCSIEETSSVNTVSLNTEMLSNDGVAYIVLSYTHTTQQVEFSCAAEVTSNMAKLATLIIKNGAIIELINHEHINTLNTVVGASADVEAQKIRDMIPSGFVELGQLDYDYMLNSENKVKIKGKSIAYVHGYRVEIPAGIIIDIGKAPEAKSREDILFLEAWKDSDFAKSGKLKWRIRHVTNVEPVGIPELGIFEGWRETSYSMATGQGRLSQPLVENKEKPRNYFYFGAFRQTWSHPSSDITDNGLGVCSETDSYAVPMFRLHRKPSCGKSIPFEYSKINPKADYSKFAKLMSDEKAERVITDNMQGRSLVNLYNGQNNVQSSTNEAKRLAISSAFKRNTLYTIVLYAKSSHLLNNVIESSFFRLQGLNVSDGVTPLPGVIWGVTGSVTQDYNRIIGTFRTPSNLGVVEFILRNCYTDWGYSGNTSYVKDIMILEGDWTNREIPEFFTGLKSLGEEDGNVITVKSGIISEDDYDINDGPQKLTVLSGTTHVYTKNSISPNIDATVKNGKQQTHLEQLGVSVETEGTEIVEFTKIKGKTLQNCYPPLISSSFVNSHSTISGGYITLQGTGAGFRNAFIPASKCTIKPNTKYTMIVDVTANTLQQNLKLATNNTEDVFKTGADAYVNVPNNATGIYKYVVTSVGQITDGMYGLRAYLNTTETGTIRFRIMLVEGDQTDVPVNQLPFIDGIKSAGEIESNIITLNSCGKNEFKESEYSVQDIGYSTVPIHYVTNPSKQYTISAQGYKNKTTNNPTWSSIIGVEYTDGTRNEIYLHFNRPLTTAKGKVIRYIYVRDAWFTQSTIYNLQIEEGAVATEYEPHVGCTQNIYLKEPLRSLPNGVCDEIVGNKVNRRIGQEIFTGAANENWLEINSRHLTNTLYFEIPKLYHSDRSIRCNHFPNKVGGDSASVWTTDAEVCNFDNHWHCLAVRINKNRLATPNLQGFRAWLSQNPLIVMHGLYTAQNECLENVYEKESGKTYQLDAPLRQLSNSIKDEIKDGVLIRRCGEMLITNNTPMRISGSNSSYNKITRIWVQTNDIPNLKEGVGGNFLSDIVYNTTTSTTLSMSVSNGFDIHFPISLTGGDTLNNVLDWLKINPIKVIYELKTPILIPLTEIAPQTANFSLQRQFAEGNWLKELPNGVGDTVENSRVKRRVTKLVLDGDEDWTGHSNNTTDGGTLYRYFLPTNNLAPIGSKQDILICDKLRVVKDIQQEIWSGENIHYRIDGSKAGIYIVKDKVTTLENFKAWLRGNPITILAPLATQTEEVITTNNYMPYPCHSLNTYCGSMYVGEGRNYVLNDNRISSENPITIKTEFRDITGGIRVEDCRYKKCDDGYNTPYTSSKSKNLISKSMYSNLWFMDDRPHLNHADSTGKHYSIYDIVINPDKIYYLSSNQVLNRVNGKWLDENKNFISFFRLSGGSGAGYTSSALPKSPTGARYLCLYVDSLGNLTSKNYNIQLEEGTSNTEYTDYIPTTKYFENTTENDIEDLRHKVSLTGFNYDRILNESFDKLLRGEL